MMLIKNGLVNTITNETKKLDILIENKKIKLIQENINEKELSNVEIIDATNKLVFPGFIDAHTHLGLWENGMGFEGADGNEETDPITPNMSPVDGINPMDLSFEEAYKNGITSVCVTPGSANVMGGECVAIKTFGRRIDNMIIKNPVASKIAFGENPKSCYGRDDKTPQTRMAIASLLRENLHSAKEYLNSIEEYEKDTEENDKPDFDIRLNSLIPVIKKEIPFKVHAHRADDIFTAIRIAKEFDLKLTLDHCTEGHLIADELLEENYPVVVGPSLSERSKIELKNLTFDTAGILSKKGVNVSLTTDHPVIPIQYLPLCAGIAIKHGMSREDALNAITINSAKILGIDDRVGSIDIGKDADIVICDSDPLINIQSNVLYTIIDGKIVYKR